jgi:hypothetical protein
VWGGHGGKFGGNGEEAVEGAVGEGSGYFGGDVGLDSVYGVSLGNLLWESVVRRAIANWKVVKRT